MNFAFPSVAVAIPTKNRPDDLDTTVASVLRQTILPKQLIIIDQSGKEESRERIIARYEALHADLRKSVELVYISDSSLTGASAARNCALNDLKTEIVLFLDDDVILEHDFNERILEAYRDHPEAVGISGIITNYPPLPALFRYWTRLFTYGPFWDDRQPLYWRAARLRESAPLKVTRLGGGLMSFATGAIGTTQFDENLHGACDGEDVDFCFKLRSVPLFIAPSARLVHKRSPGGRGREHWLSKHARTNWYLYQRNWNHGLRNRLCFVWLNVGYALATMLVSIRRISFVPWTSLLRAIREANDLIGIKPDPGSNSEARLPKPQYPAR
ncbi:MAG TPA: glycosyltransferase [Verrucomicrobiae bacterium]|nr:glycosyltransferase [Verrucomicrobiae bacterium]